MNEQRQMLGTLICEREKAIREGKVSQDNLLDLILKSELKRDYGEEEIPGQVKLFFFAGYETTRNLLVWTLVLLSTYQDWQERARQEAFQVFENRKADYQGLSQLKVVSIYTLLFIPQDSRLILIVIIPIMIIIVRK